MEKETKVTLEVSTSVLQMIEKAKERLAKESTFNFVKHLSVDDFLNFFFGFSEISQFCREAFFKSFKEVIDEGPPSPEEAETKAEIQVEKPVEKLGYVSPLMKKVIDVLKLSKIPLTMRQISDSAEIRLRSAEWILSDLAKKGIISRVPRTHQWRLNLEVAQKYDVRGPAIKERLLEFLKITKEPMSTVEIAKKIDAKRRTISEYLWDLKEKGIVERISIRSNLTKWRLKERKSMLRDEH